MDSSVASMKFGSCANWYWSFIRFGEICQGRARGVLPDYCLFHCSIRQCPKVGEYLWRFRRIHHALREQDADHPLCGIGVCRCAEAASPTESAWCVKDFFALNVHCHSETPAAMHTEKDLGSCTLLRHELI